MANIYNNSKIFKIINNVNTEYYLGYTTEELNIKMLYYKTYFKQWLSNNVTDNPLIKRRNTDTTILFNNLFLKYGVNNCSIILVQNYPCTGITILKKRLNLYIKNNTSPNNIRLKENIKKLDNRQDYNIINKSKIKAKRRECYLLNKDRSTELDKLKINAARRANYLLNKDKAKEYYLLNKDKAKEYYLLNKSKIQSIKKEYYLLNKDRSTELDKLKINAARRANYLLNKDKAKEYYLLNKQDNTLINKSDNILINTHTDTISNLNIID
jgi:hypothetical protein